MDGEDLRIGGAILEHLGIDQNYLLERNQNKLDGTDCSEIVTSIVE